MKKLLFIFSLLGIFRAQAMDITAEKHLATLKDYINRHFWLGVVYDITSGNITPNDVCAYPKEILDEQDTGGATLFERLINQIRLSQRLMQQEKSQRLTEFLKTLIRLERITHNEELVRRINNYNFSSPDSLDKLIQIYKKATSYTQAMQLPTPQPQPGTPLTTQAQQPEHQKPNKPSFIFANGKYMIGGVILAVAALYAYKYYIAKSTNTDDESEENKEASVQEPKL